MKTYVLHSLNGVFFKLLPYLILLKESFAIQYNVNIFFYYSGFFSDKFPRPLVTNFFYFALIFFILKVFIEKNINKYIFAISILLALILTSSFFIFISSILLFLFIIFGGGNFYLFKSEILNSKLKILFCSLIFLGTRDMAIVEK